MSLVSGSSSLEDFRCVWALSYRSYLACCPFTSEVSLDDDRSARKSAQIIQTINDVEKSRKRSRDENQQLHRQHA